MYKVVLFDLDGTILNTAPDIRAVLNATLAEFNLPQVSEEQTKRFVGNGAYMLVKRAVGGKNEELINAVYRRYSHLFSQCDNCLSHFYDGEEQTLDALRMCGVKMGIITNKPQAATLNVYQRYFKKYGFFFVQGQEEGVELKPSPKEVLRAVELSGENKKSCLFVGDGETDVQTAKNAGVDCVSVLWGYRSESQLKAAGATTFAHGFDELKDIVLK